MIKNFTLFLFCSVYLFSFGNDSTYVERQIDYANTSLQNNGGNKLTLKAFQNIPIDSLELYEILAEVPNKYNPDFEIVELVRVLFYSDSLYDDQILPVLAQVPFWLNNGDTLRNFWTENHMIMWMSSEWLLHERYGIPIDNDLRPRLLHYLELKKEYGFYEYFSSVYAPYTLSGLLNLYEFTEDAEIKNLSKEVAQLLLQDMLKPTTDLGVYYPASGRSYPEKYNSAYGQNHSSLIYLLTGMGVTPTRATHAGAFLSTSSLPIDVVTNSWTPNIDTEIQIGHPLENSAAIHSSLNSTDQLIFQWSTGSYAHPTLIQQSFQLLADSNLWEHKDWDALRPLSSIPPDAAPGISESLSVLSTSSVLSEQKLRLFKNNSVSLMSIADLSKGKIGFQQWPFVATVGTSAVYTLSGKVNTNWGNRDRSIENSHLPHVEQKSNIALIMYRPETVPEVLQVFAGEMIEDQEVGLFWKDDDYDEVVENENWLIGRQNQNYIAVRRHCTEKMNTWWACNTESGQTWVVMVGDSTMYNDFNNFQSIIEQSQFTEEWYFNVDSTESAYYAQINIDTLTLDYVWGNDELIAEPTKKISGELAISLYPNPTNDIVKLKLNSSEIKTFNIRVVNSIGATLYYKEMDFSPDWENEINTKKWPVGVYSILLQNKKEKLYQKLIKF